MDLPAIDTLADGLATLVNGWQVRFAPVLDRRCSGEDFTSYRELLGDDFTSVFGIDERRLIAVECRTRVDYAPVPAAVDEPEASVPAPDAAAAADSEAEVDDLLAAALLGLPLDEAVDRLTGAGWTVRTSDLDDPDGTFTLDLPPDRVTVQHRDGVTVGVAVG